MVTGLANQRWNWTNGPQSWALLHPLHSSWTRSPELYLSRGHPTQLKLLLPLSASSRGGGARDRKLRHPSAPTRAPSESLWSVKVLVCLPVGLACTLAARQMKRPKFQTTWETGFGVSIASPRIGMISGGT